MIKKLLIVLLFCALFSTLAFAQTKIEGLLIDSTYNNVLHSATVSVYEQDKTAVEKVTLTDRYGKFIIENIAADKAMRIEFSFQGFEKNVREFVLKKDQHLDLGGINMNLSTIEIEAVDITPPVRMNGDTIEFNADAFELDTNAVIEDLLHKLPGLVVWGDGTVTYNGKEVPTVLVNGKTFFGSDKAIVLQNIDKKAVDKIQVYDSRNEDQKQENPEDKNYEMNVVLKEGRENMYFGNAGAGAGTKGHYQGALNLNYGTDKSQSTVAYSTNNVNKDLYNVNQLLKNTTYKGIGINADFDSDFMRSGMLDQHVLGGRYQYDFLGTNQVGFENLFTADVISHWNNTTFSNTSNTQLLNAQENSENTRSYVSESNINNDRQQANLYYRNTASKIGVRPISVNGLLNAQNKSNNNTSTSLNHYDSDNSRSSNKQSTSSSNNEQSLDAQGGFDIHSKAGRNTTIRGSTNYSFLDQVTYSFKVNAYASNSHKESFTKGDYENFIDPNLNRIFHRTYDENLEERRWGIDLKANRMGFTLGHHISHYNTNSQNEVYDLNDSNDKTINHALSHRSDYRQWVYQPYLEYVRPLISKNLYGRMFSSLSLNLKLGAKIYRDENTSTLDHRNLALKYNSFLPSTSLRYFFNKTNDYSSDFSINYNYDEEYPLLNRMRPIYDDINPAYRYYGSDRLLDKTGVHTFRFNSSYRQIRQYAWVIRLNFNYKVYQNGLTDSILYAENEQQNYVAQIKKPMDIYTINLNLDKPFLIGKEQTLTLSINGSTNWGNKYQYIDSQLQEMLNNSQNLNINTYYTLLNKYQIGWTNRMNRYHRSDRMANSATNNYTSYEWDTGLSMAYALTKRWSVNSNATGRFYSSTYNSDRALIWNANTTYRILKDNTLEIKLAAYDLLRQNKGMYYSNSVTEFTTSYRNILTQYYMLSISYFPRKFGLK